MLPIQDVGFDNEELETVAKLASSSWETVTRRALEAGQKVLDVTLSDTKHKARLHRITITPQLEPESLSLECVKASEDFEGAEKLAYVTFLRDTKGKWHLCTPATIQRRGDGVPSSLDLASTGLKTA